MPDTTVKVVFETRIPLARIQEAIEKVRATLAEFGEACADAGHQMTVLGTRVPAPSSLWEFADDRDPDGLWAVAHDYRGDTTMVTLKRIDGPKVSPDSAFSWHGSVANHNKTFRRSNA